MKFPQNIIIVMTLCLWPMTAHAEDTYDINTWADDVVATRWEAGAVWAGVTALGLNSWEWGSSKSFRWKREGWFEADSYLGGSDKLGHAYTSYAVGNVLYDHLLTEGRSPERAMMSAVLTTQAIMTYMEVLDGYSGKYRFSPEDMISNLLGSGFAYIRATRPGMRELIDFRLEYELPAYEGFQFRSNYLIAIKLGGIESMRETAFKYFELQAGYFTRGYIRAEQKDGYEQSRHLFFGVGLNISELLFGPRQNRETTARKNGRLMLEHVQVPYTATRAARKL